MKLVHRVAFIVIAGLTPIIAVEVFNSFALQRARETEINQTALRQAEYAASELERIIEGTRGVMMAVGQAPSVRSFNSELCGHFVARLLQQLNYVTGLLVVDETGQVKCASSEAELSINVTDRPYFQRSLQSTDFVIGEYVIGRLSKQPVLPLALPIVDENGKHIGAVISSLNLEWLSSQLLKRGLPDGGSVTVADRNGMILARQPNPEKFVGTKIPDAYMHLLFEKDAGVIDVLSQDGTSRVLGFIPLNETPRGLYVSAGLSEDNSFLFLRSAAWRQSIVSVIAVLGSILGAYLLARYFVAKPLDQLLRTVQKWKGGDLEARTGLISTHGEAGHLGEEFDRTMDQLARRQETIAVLLRELAHRSKNQISLLISLASQLAKGKSSVDAYKNAIVERLMSMSTAQDLLLEAGDKALFMGDVVRAHTKGFAKEGTDRITLSGPNLSLSPETARYLGMAIHELATNASKYGALSDDKGRVIVSWQSVEAPDQIEFKWREVDGPPVESPTRAGFGRTLIEKIVPTQLKGRANIAYNADGLIWVMRFFAGTDLT